MTFGLKIKPKQSYHKKTLVNILEIAKGKPPDPLLLNTYPEPIFS